MKKSFYFTAILCILFSSCAENKQNAPTIYQVEESKIEFKDDSFENENGKFQLLMSDKGDLNNDGINDMVSLIQLQSSGSGTFYYLNVHIGEDNENFTFLDQKFIGDRIKPDFLTIYKKGSFSNITGTAIHPDDYGQIAFGYYTHGKDQPFSEAPKLYLTPKWRLENDKLQAVENY